MSYNGGAYPGQQDNQYNSGYPPAGGFQDQNSYQNQGSGYPAPGGYPPAGGFQDQNSYQNQGSGYPAPGGKHGVSSFNPAALDPNLPVDKLVGQLLGDAEASASVHGLQVHENSARDLAEFDMDAFAREFGTAGDSVNRGIFGFDTGRGESKKSHQLIGGAAAWAAFKWYENWKLNTKGEKVNHSFIKKALTAFAVAQVIKISEQKSSGFQHGMTRDIAIQEATRNISRIADIKYPDYNTGYQYDEIRGGEAESFNSGAY
ncbi:hypothetical protein COEREDRAFT_93567 [Coemansia reversa NRRL 1564]|uniref:Uncharacterized protein n=1 Tax=Coemansia reversa (strain ATCC 12441 / NRRL 1564) TaxID=763665 RepID=A0A2G5B7B0_COERN|nr:hypothetical protein COEREDRAFT_93567 [Coemansia reversa NRRL 1564]|eukprot:PIA14916.1 hypothetical protein COEREDRAFT_93567 [Coemansia reversa NRRL 1564]